jgi:hypothetical protein
MNAKSLYQTGIQYFQQNQFNQGVKFLLDSAKLKYTPAIKEIGLCFLYGIGVKPSLNKAIKYFKISKSESESQFELSKLYYFGYGLEKNLNLSRQLLISAVNQDYIPAINLMAMSYKLNGKNKKSNALFFRSYQLKDRLAKHLFINKLINKTNKNCDFVNKFKWPKFKKTYSKNKLNKKPKIFSIANLLSHIECEYIKFIATPFMRESMTIDPKTGATIRDSIRTSHSAALDWTVEDPAINLIMNKCCQLFKVTASQSEVLHVLHYSVGEEYKPHYDFFGGIDGQKNFDPSTQRIKTICLYLNDVESGGQTSFPRLDLKVTPKKGTAVFFENVNSKTKEPYIESLHASDPVINGEKWLATLWIRNQDTPRGPDYDSVPTK